MIPTKARFNVALEGLKAKELIDLGLERDGEVIFLTEKGLSER